MKKQVVIFAFCALCCGLFVLYSDPALEAARQGFYLWRDAVLPALLPFFICAHIMQNCGAISMQNPLFLYSVSMVSGAPTGARLAGSLEEDHTPAVAALNAVSPMFIAGSFAGSIIGVPQLAWPILIAQLVSAGFFFLLAKPAAGPALPRPNPPSFSACSGKPWRPGLRPCSALAGPCCFSWPSWPCSRKPDFYPCSLRPLSNFWPRFPYRNSSPACCSPACWKWWPAARPWGKPAFPCGRPQPWPRFSSALAGSAS